MTLHYSSCMIPPIDFINLEILFVYWNNKINHARLWKRSSNFQILDKLSLINWKHSTILYLDVISSNDSLESSRHWNICQHQTGDLAPALETLVWHIWLQTLSLHRVCLSDILEFSKQHLNVFYLWRSQIYELLLFSVWKNYMNIMI